MRRVELGPHALQTGAESCVREAQPWFTARHGQCCRQCLHRPASAAPAQSAPMSYLDTYPCVDSKIAPAAHVVTAETRGRTRKSTPTLVSANAASPCTTLSGNEASVFHVSRYPPGSRSRCTTELTARPAAIAPKNT